MDRGGRALQLLHRPAEVHPAAAAAVLEPAAQLPDPLAMLVGGACVMMCTSMSHVLKHAFACCCADGDICLIERVLHHSGFNLTADFKLCASGAHCGASKSEGVALHR